MTIPNSDSLFAVNVRAPYFSSSSSCEPRLGSSLLFLTSAAAHAAVTNLSVYAATKGAVYAATKGAVETLVGQLPSSSASTAPGACNGVVSRRPAIVAFCKQPEDVQEAARLRRVRQRCGSRPTMRPGRGASTADLTPRSANLERASCQVWRRRRVLRMERCIPLARLFPATVANVTQFLRAEILL
jgi:NAD(P)-dependent dehydrogenase (short-subunit alcohol dehydrogenase family)